MIYFIYFYISLFSEINIKGMATGTERIKRGYYTEQEAFEYIFSHSNSVGATIAQVEYGKFTIYKHLWKKGELKAPTKEKLLDAFKFKTAYKL